MKKNLSHFIVKNLVLVIITASLSACSSTPDTYIPPTSIPSGTPSIKETTPNPTTEPTIIPDSTTTPEATITPVFTATPELTATSAPTVTPNQMPTSAPTSTPEPTTTLTPTSTLEPTATLAPTSALEPTATLAPTSAPEPTVSPAPTSTPTVTDPNVRNLNGMELVIAIPYYSPEPNTPENLALKAYREQMMQKHNFTVRIERLTDYGDPTHVFQTATTLGDPTFQVYHINTQDLGNNAHLFYDLSTLSEFDFNDEKWNDAITKAMTYKGGIYGVSPLTSEMPQISGIVYNKRLFKEAGLDPDLPYELQKNGEWTWEKFKEICALLTRDTNGDGTTDVYATCSYGGEMLEQLLSSTGSQIVTNNNGTFVNNATSDTVLRAVTFAQELALSEHEYPPNGFWDYYMTAFSSGKAAMQFAQSSVLYDKYNSYTRMTDELGFVCCPKMDSSTDYRMVTANYAAVIPAFYDAKTASDIAFAYNLWTNPVPTNDSYDWRTLYNGIALDEKILTETFPYYYEKNLGEVPARYLVTCNVDTAFYYPFPFTDAPIKQYLEDLSAILSEDVAKVNTARKPNVTANANFESNNYSTRVNYDGTVTISRFKHMVTGDLVLPDTINGMIVSEIAGDVFSNCSLTSVVLPKGLKKIGSWAFAFGDFTDFVLPDGVTTLCFSSITGANLQTVTVPASVTEIEKGAISSNVDLTLIVEKGSYAETYAKKNGYKVQYK